MEDLAILARVVAFQYVDRGRSRIFEAAVPVSFLKAGAFDAQNLITIPHAKLLRALGRLSPEHLGQVEAAVRTWLGLASSEA